MHFLQKYFEYELCSHRWCLVPEDDFHKMVESKILVFEDGKQYIDEHLNTYFEVYVDVHDELKNIMHTYLLVAKHQCLRHLIQNLLSSLDKMSLFSNNTVSHHQVGLDKTINSKRQRQWSDAFIICFSRVWLWNVTDRDTIRNCE